LTLTATETYTHTSNAATCGSGPSCMCASPGPCATTVSEQTQYTRATNTLVTTSAVGRTRTLTLDSKNRVTQDSVPGVAAVSVLYDAEGRVSQVSQAARSILYHYWPDGTLKSVTDPASRVASFMRDAAGRATSTTVPGGRTVLTSFDAAGNLTSVTPPGGSAHAQGFDLRDLMASYVPPTVSGANGNTTYESDRDRRLKKLLRSDGGLSFGYNSATSFLDTVTSSDASVTFGRLTDGRISSISTGAGVGLAFTYDGSLLLSTTWSGLFSQTVSHTYDHRMRRATSNLAGATVTWVYDNDDLLTAATGVGSGIVIARDPLNGRITGSTVGQVVHTAAIDATYGERSGIAYATTLCANVV
jgi:YD repeat-containing protein